MHVSLKVLCAHWPWTVQVKNKVSVHFWVTKVCATRIFPSYSQVCQWGILNLKINNAWSLGWEILELQLNRIIACGSCHVFVGCRWPEWFTYHNLWWDWCHLQGMSFWSHFAVLKLWFCYSNHFLVNTSVVWSFWSPTQMQWVIFPQIIQSKSLISCNARIA